MSDSRPGPLKYWLDQNDSGTWGEDPVGVDDTVVLRSTEIGLDGGWEIDDPALRQLPAAERARKRLVEGDLVVVKSSGSAAHLGKTAIVNDEVARLGACFANFVQRLRPALSADSRYLWYFLSSKTASDQLSMLGNTTTGLRNLNGETIGAVTFPGMPVVSQRTIADFLDTETARIDALIAKKRRLSATLKERWRTEVGAVLNEFRAVPLKRVVAYTEGPGIMAEDFRDEGVPLVRVAGVGGEQVTLDGCNFLDPGKVKRRWAHFALSSGDRVISASASMGTVSVVDELAAGAIPYTGLIRFRPRLRDVDMLFVEYFLGSSTFMDQIDLMKTGTAIQHFGPSHLGAVAIPWPDLGTQQVVAARLRRSQDLTSRGIEALERQVALLQEHRQALITAAVTGELTVPGAA